ncbi:transposase, partial [Kosmotoga sp. DU53]|uniref:transposase n=1 Tax=Kosmotoga sp. DU53 TaxID=1310160 RepID=UPI0007C5D9A3
MKGKTPRRYSSEFKIKLVKEYLGTDKSYRELGVEYDVDASLIMSWVKRYERYKENAFQPPKRKPSFIADESKIPAFLKEELGLDKIKEH